MIMKVPFDFLLVLLQFYINILSPVLGWRLGNGDKDQCKRAVGGRVQGEKRPFSIHACALTGSAQPR